MPIVNLESVIAVVPVTDQVTAVTWYKKLLGRDADVVPIDGVAEWQLAEKVWLQVTTDPDNVGNTTVIISVNDIDAQCTACTEANVSLGEVVEYPGIVKMVDAIDPDGNKITFVQELSSEANTG
jgi:predicted enzyme related to lactoylglutathione lyase